MNNLILVFLPVELGLFKVSAGTEAENPRKLENISFFFYCYLDFAGHSKKQNMYMKKGVLYIVFSLNL